MTERMQGGIHVREVHVHEPTVASTVTLLGERLVGRKRSLVWRCGGCAGMVFDGNYWYRREADSAQQEAT